MQNEEKRLFFGAEVHAAWPKEFPHGRIIDEESRHITLAFLGQTSFARLESILPALPLPQFKIGKVGKIDRFLFLPERNPRVVAGHVHWFSGAEDFLQDIKSL